MTLEKTGAAIAPPPLRAVCGSFISTTATNLGLLAGANHAKKARWFVSVYPSEPTFLAVPVLPAT